MMTPDEADLAAGRAIQNACANLPEGWTITIELEKDGGSIKLTDPDGDDISFSTNHENFHEETNDAVEHARETKDN